MTMMTTEEKELVKATVPVLKTNGVQLTTHFYQRMFRYNPELKHTFNQGNQQNGRQQMALAMAVLAYAEHIDDPSVLLPVLNHIGHKHVSLSIRPEHYAIVGRHLLASIGEVLGEAATPELIQAWAKAYQQLSKLMSGVEADLYEQNVAQEGGWTGWRPFRVEIKQAESSEITSFYLIPVDGGPVAPHQPGQFLSVRVFLPQLQLLQPRQYSISSAPNQRYYRISVKRETNAIPSFNGMISNYLHDHIQEGDTLDLSAPAGEFTLELSDSRPSVFISGGVGQTPLLSMLEHLLDSPSKQPIHWIHGCRHAGVHAFKNVLAEWEAAYPHLHTHLFYSQLPELGGSQAGVQTGIVDISQLPASVLDPEALYYVCGPSGFITKQFEDLQAAGIPASSIRFEEFGPQSLAL